MDTFGRPHLEQTPWAPDLPSSYLPEHVYFVHGRLDGPGDAPFAGDWLAMTGKQDMLLFGSSYPDWQVVTPGDLPQAWSARQRAQVLGGNAARLYGLQASATAPA
jgi:predicted TIM-barrel fold metal-dependent hydrolase